MVHGRGGGNLTLEESYRPDDQQEGGRVSSTSGLRATCLQTGVGFKVGIICQSIHSEKTVLEVSIRIGGRKSSDEIQDLEGVRLGHSLHNIVKLGLAAGNAFKVKLSFGLN